MNQTLHNDILTVTASSAGAELQSIRDNRSGYEFLWQGDPRFWKRRSPVLFPIVGAVWDGVFRMDGRDFPMGQHGFARDMEFKPVADTPDDEMWFSLEADNETLSKYPRRFRLEIGYRLQQERISVMWRVTNLDSREMHFQIGAHPAFNLPDFDPSDKVHGYFMLDAEKITSEIIAAKGCVGGDTKEIELDGGVLPIQADTFKDDALIVGDNRLHRVSLMGKEQLPVLSLLFRSPYVGLWAPSADAPFVCIEPWYGRADSTGFTGDFSEKIAVNTLAPGQTFSAEYFIIIERL